MKVTLMVSKDGALQRVKWSGEVDDGASLEKMAATAMCEPVLPPELTKLRGALLEWTVAEWDGADGWH